MIHYLQTTRSKE